MVNSKFHQKIREIGKSNKSAVQTMREFWRAINKSLSSNHLCKSPDCVGAGVIQIKWKKV